ncbi:MAG: DUF1570 domain-containing protein [Planctomycetota bacterium]
MNTRSMLLLIPVLLIACTAVGDETTIQQLIKEPSKNYEEILNWQRNRIKEVNEKLGIKAVVIETDHYIVSSALQPGAAKQIANGCEDLYKKMSKVFAVQKEDRLWAGKCVVYIFENKDQFVQFAEKIDNLDPDKTQEFGGYFSNRGGLVHIPIPTESGGEARFESTLIHEGAHAFLQLFRQDIRIKPWINEGVAQYFENVCFPHSGRWSMKRAMVRNQSDFTLAQLREVNSVWKVDSTQVTSFYAHAWSAISFMIRANPKKFVKFIDAIKEGKSDDDALTIAFGKDMNELERAWRAYVKKSF